MKRIIKKTYQERKKKILSKNPKAALFLDAEIPSNATFVANDGAIAYLVKKGEHYEFGGFISSKKGAGARLLVEIIDKYKKIELFCIGTILMTYYKKFGFNIVEIVKWCDDYAPHGWDYDRLGRPDLYVMRNF